MSFFTLNNDTERHYLQHQYASKPTLIEEPVGWKKSDKKLSRSRDTGEFLEKNAKSVEFIGKGRDYITTADAIYGSNLKIKYFTVKQNPKDASDFFKDIYFIDIESMKDQKGKLACKIDEGGLSKLIKSKGREKVELDRTTSLDGKNISALKKVDLELKGRKLLLTSKLEGNTDSVLTTNIKTYGYTRAMSVAFPLRVTDNDDTDHIFPVESPTEYEYNLFSKSDFFYIDSEVDKTLNLDFDLSFTLTKTDSQKVNWGYVTVSLLTTDTNNNLIDEEFLLFPINVGNAQSQVLPYQQNYRVKKSIKKKVKVGQNLGVHFRTGGNFGDSGSVPGRWNFKYTNCKGSVNIVEDSERPPSRTKAILAHEAGDRFLEIITGRKGLFKSNFLGRKEIGYKEDGKGAYNLLYPLLWVRGFIKKPNQPKPSISLKDYLNSLSVIWGGSMMIEKKGFQEYLRFEDFSFFYVHSTTIELPNQVEDLKISYAKNFLHTSYEFGYEKGGSNYEEATGIGEYNGTSTYSTIRNNDEKKRVLKSKIRVDSSAEEFARRKPFKGFSQTDTRYDSDWFLKDGKKGRTSVYLERRWRDDFKSAPSGIYSPDSATNLRFTPLQVMLRHAFFITGNLSHYIDSFLTYISSNCNANIELEKKDGTILKGNSDIPLKSLGKPRFKSYWYEFTHEVTFDLQKKLRGKSIVNGREIYNFYGLVKFKIEGGEIKKGYLFQVDENKGKWKVLLAN